MKTEYRGIPYVSVNPDISPVKLDSLLKSNNSRWTIIVYNHIIDKLAEIPHQVKAQDASKKFILKQEFEKQVRLIRNSNYWIASESDIFRYLKEKEAASLKTEQYENMIFLKIVHPLDPSVYDYPLTIEYISDAKLIRIEGSENDGSYNNRDGYFLFNVLPNKEVTIEIIE